MVKGIVLQNEAIKRMSAPWVLARTLGPNSHAWPESVPKEAPEVHEFLLPYL